MVLHDSPSGLGFLSETMVNVRDLHAFGTIHMACLRWMGNGIMGGTVFLKAQNEKVEWGFGTLQVPAGFIQFLGRCRGSQGLGAGWLLKWLRISPGFFFCIQQVSLDRNGDFWAIKRCQELKLINHIISYSIKFILFEWFYINFKDVNISNLFFFWQRLLVDVSTAAQGQWNGGRPGERTRSGNPQLKLTSVAEVG